MAGSGLLALLDDLTALADDLATLTDDVAALSDDVATLTVAAGKKTTGLVTDDMAVTAEQTLGLAHDREIPVVLAVARGSLFNKCVVLAPGALLLDAVAPWAIGPLLMAGGLFLCFEGVEKLVHKVRPHGEHGGHGGEGHAPPRRVEDPVAFEARRVKGAIRTDLILSAEIVAITMGTVQEADFLVKATVLYAVSVALTVGVYGIVGGLVKLDDLGLALVRRGGGLAGVGRLIVRGTPWLMATISWVGTVAMLVVGGHILLEGIPPLEHLVHGLVHGVPHALEGVAGFGLDVAVGAIFGAMAWAVVATGLPGRAWAAVSGGGASD
ncbi:MAG: DUF808 domain-containing protein [Alphaproteobacteria bacterium]|nr:DUF808 domain-containing protein [Alphaproteobacteria bacterium]